MRLESLQFQSFGVLMQMITTSPVGYKEKLRSCRKGRPNQFFPWLWRKANARNVSCRIFVRWPNLLIKPNIQFLKCRQQHLGRCHSRPQSRLALLITGAWARAVVALPRARLYHCSYVLRCRHVLWRNVIWWANHIMRSILAHAN